MLSATPGAWISSSAAGSRRQDERVAAPILRRKGIMTVSLFLHGEMG